MYFGVFTYPMAIVKKYEKLHIQKKLRVCKVNDYEDSRFLNFAIKYLHENKS